jgi:predicted metal-dependent hydrolase
MPPQVIDYVVVLELTHLKVPDHSPAFWMQVEQFLPDYEAKRRWLKAKGGEL